MSLGQRSGAGVTRRTALQMAAGYDMVGPGTSRQPVPHLQIRVVGMGGSLAPTSASLAALKVALEEAAAAGANTQLLDLRALDLPMFMPTAAPSESVLHFCDAVYAAHGLLWSSPLYNGTVSGAFKNAIDWLHLLGDLRPPYLTDKIVGLISTAGGVNGLQAVNTMEFITRSLCAWAVPLVLPIPPPADAFGTEGNVRDPRVAAQLRAVGQEVARAAHQMTVRGIVNGWTIGAPGWRKSDPHASALAHRNRDPRDPHHPGGAFDRYPRLQIVIGHLGEALPFML